MAGPDYIKLLETLIEKTETGERRWTRGMEENYLTTMFTKAWIHIRRISTIEPDYRLRIYDIVACEDVYESGRVKKEDGKLFPVLERLYKCAEASEKGIYSLLDSIMDEMNAPESSAEEGEQEEDPSSELPW